MCGLALCHMRMRIYYILFEEGLSTLINRPKYSLVCSPSLKKPRSELYYLRDDD